MPLSDLHRRGLPAYLEPVVLAAIDEADYSPCRKSTRGAAVFTWNAIHSGGAITGTGCNHPAAGSCSPTAPCGGGDRMIGLVSACSLVCEHAEEAALRRASAIALFPSEIVHVKVVRGDLVPSGPPSCITCSRAILCSGLIDLVWLYHEDGWVSRTASGFHAATLRHLNTLEPTL